MLRACAGKVGVGIERARWETEGTGGSGPVGGIGVVSWRLTAYVRLFRWWWGWGVWDSFYAASEPEKSGGEELTTRT